MQRTLVFIPVSRQELSAITGEVELTERTAHTVTPELLDALDYDEHQLEEAEHGAMLLASVAALARYGERLVLVAEVEPGLVRPGTDRANGECMLAQVPVGAITCWFGDADDVDPSPASAAVRGLGIDEAWESDAVSELVGGHHLLWNDVVEYQRSTPDQ